MHPLLSAQVANAILDEKQRYAAQRRRASRRRRVDAAPPSPRLRAPWHAGWSPNQPTMRSE
jgi:hypothetical protein